VKTIREMLYAGCTAKIIAHTETCNSLNRPRPRDKTRFAGYDQHDPADVLLQCQNAKALGIDALMFNTYAVGSWENLALMLFLPATIQAGLEIMVNIDKGIYATQPVPQTAISNYIAWLQTNVFPAMNYCRDKNGKFIVTYFANPNDNPAMFRAIEAEFPYITFVYNDPSKGPNTMAWIQSDLTANLDWWIRTFGLKTDGSLQIPCVYPGFNDTFNGQSVWGGAARVWPAGIGPNAATLQACFDTINKYYSVNHQPEFIQLVTLDDDDEGTNMETPAGGVNKWFAPVPPPVVIDHGEVWVDGVKFGDLKPGSHTATVVDVYSDGTTKKTSTTIDIA